MALFNKQKQEKKKKGENVIGKIIYGFLLFAPLLNILVTCMYVTFNKNAYESYSGNQETTINYKYKSNEVTTVSDLITGNIYQMNIPLNENLQLNFTCTKIMLLNGRQTTMTYDSDFIANVNDSYFNVYINNNNLIIYHQPSNTSVSNRTYEQNIHFLFVFKDYMQSGLISYVSYTDYNEIENVNIANETLDNAFIYGTQKTEESNLFNWAKTTGTYTVLNNVTTGIGITNTFIPMLMAYWLLISVIYFLYDIALILIWAVHDKIHDLKDAI